MAGKAKYKSYADWFEKILSRFWSNVDKSQDCWIWTGSKSHTDPRSPLSYGQFDASFRGERLQYRAHRLSWTLANGQIPDGMLVLHKCDVPLCVNPAHLFLGTHKDNAIDREVKGRGTIGVKNGRAVLTDDVVMRIRKSPFSDRAWAKMLKVHPSTIGYARSGKKWRHLPMPKGQKQ